LHLHRLLPPWSRATEALPTGIKSSNITVKEERTEVASNGGDNVHKGSGGSGRGDGDEDPLDFIIDVDLVK
jgi:hypothetical protein